MGQIFLLISEQQVVVLDLVTPTLKSLANVYVLAVRLLENVVFSHGVDTVMEEVLVEDFETVALWWHERLTPCVPRRHLVKEKPLVHESILILLNDLTELFDDCILTNHFFHLLLDHSLLRFKGKLVLSGNLCTILIDLPTQLIVILAFQIVHNFILPILDVFSYFLIFQSFCFLNSVLILQFLD